MFIDFASRPPLPEFSPPAPHLQNYRRIYKASEHRSAATDAAQGIEGYLQAYEDLQAKHVVLKARDLETTFGFCISNDVVADFCKKHEPRYIGFGGVDPHKGHQAVLELERAVKELGLIGLNIQCFEHKLAPNDPRLFPLYEKCIELDIPVNIHCGINFCTLTPMSYGRPEYLDEVMVAFPGLRVCASPPGWPWINELIGVAWRHPNLYIGVLAVNPKLLKKAHSGYEPLLQYGRTILKDQIIFGSSFPLMSPHEALHELRQLDLEQQILDRWTGANAARFLKL